MSNDFDRMLTGLFGLMAEQEIVTVLQKWAKQTNKLDDKISHPAFYVNVLIALLIKITTVADEKDRGKIADEIVELYFNGLAEAKKQEAEKVKK